MRRIQRPVSKAVTRAAAPAARPRAIRSAEPAAVGPRDTIRAPPSAAQSHISQSRSRRDPDQDRSSAVQTQISLSALLSICNGPPAARAAPQQMVGPAPRAQGEPGTAPASPPRGAGAERTAGPHSPDGSPLRQLISSRLQEVRAAAAEARAAEQEAAFAMKQRLAAVAATAKAARARSATPRKLPAPPAPAYHAERPTASHSAISGSLTAGAAQAPQSSLPEGLGSPSRGNTNAASAAACVGVGAAASEEGATLQPVSPVKGLASATGTGLLPSDWPKPRAPPPTWRENPGPPLPESFSTPSRKPAQRPSFAAAGGPNPVRPASGWWSGAGPSPRPGEPQTPSSCGGMSTAGPSPITHHPWTPAGKSSCREGRDCAC